MLPTNQEHVFVFYRDLAATEESSRTALSSVEQMESDIKNLQQEVDLLNKQKKSLTADITVAQKDLQGKDQLLVLSCNTF